MAEETNILYKQPLDNNPSINLTLSAENGNKPEVREQSPPKKVSSLGDGWCKGLFCGQRICLQRPGCAHWFLILIVLAIIVVAAVVPPVCVLRGCGSHKHTEQAPEPVYRLIVSFQTIEKTVKSIVPPALYEYVDEVLLQSSGLHIVSFNSSEVKAAIRDLIEAQPDLDLLLEDREFYRAPQGDMLAADSEAASKAAAAAAAIKAAIAAAAVSPNVSAAAAAAAAAAGSATTTQRRHLAADASTSNYEGSLWQRSVVNFDGAWNITEGVAGVVIAVIDTGCELNHPDLKSNIWVNELELGGDPGVDDDGNGLIDDIYGYDFSGDPTTTPKPKDIHSHGTHCGGIAAAAYNGQGVSGVAPNVRIMCLKAAGTESGVFYTSAVLRALDYAHNMGAHIVSCSFGPQLPNLFPSKAEQDTMWNETKAYQKALRPLVRKDMLIFAAAGNENFLLDDLDKANSTYNPCTMARYYPNNMMCVMATNPQDQRMHELSGNVDIGSNYGTKYVDIGAPGRQILSTVPSLYGTGYQLYANKTGSSAATPLVAGVAALILSVIGPASCDFYQGSKALQILVDSSDKIPNLPVRTSSRVNAAQAVLKARASLDNLFLLTPMTGFNSTNQTVMINGFNETYFAGDIGLEDQSYASLNIYDTSARFTKSLFDSYKYGAGYTLVVRASVYLNQSGIYLMKISTTANSVDLVIKLGQSKLANLNTTIQLSTDTAGGWYEFQLRYRNPVAPIDIRMALPNSGGAAGDYQYLNVFYVSTDFQPGNLYYAPSIALSSAFQVLTRPVNASTLTRASIADGPFPKLQLDQPYNYSSVLPDLSFTDMATGLRDALYPNMNDTVPMSVVGIVHTRLRAPEIPMRFQLTCQLCALYINSLQVLDVFTASTSTGTTTTTTTTSMPTKLSGCLAQLSSSRFPTHDLTIRFALANTSATGFKLSWMPCDALSGSQATTVTTHVANNLLWKPSSGVAGYVPGMQCDVWPDGYPLPLGESAPYPYESQPWLKFRLPIAIAQTPRVYNSSTLGTYVNSNFSSSSGCRADNESFSNGCYSYASLTLNDVFNSIGAQYTIAGTALSFVYIRCYTYVNRGFRSGVTSLRTSSTQYTFLGSQSVYRNEKTTALRGPYNAASTAPNVTSMQGYYQLLVFESRYVGPASQVGLLDGGFNGNMSSDNFKLDMSNTLLPIPVVSSTTSSATRPSLRLLLSPSSSEPSETPSSRFSSSASSVPSSASSAKEKGQMPRHAAAAAAAAGGRRGLLQTAVSSSGYMPTALGSSAWSLSQVSSTQRIVATVFQPNATAPYEAIPGLSSLVVNNYTSTAVQSVVSVAGSLSGSVPVPANGAGTNRYVRVEGFFRSPAAAGEMSKYVLRVRDGDGQSVAITMGNITVRNAVEFPTQTVLQTRGEIVLPAGFVPTLVTVKNKRSDAKVVLDLGLTPTAAAATSQTEVAMEWYPLATSAANASTTAGR
ncbi:hypothetical protein Agub_g2923 [Astrephomene gubernaculifera]|uniref:Peptidase S8/S53 domain-containing protein n=1 Tax=Astrephomene gubernaculifera TaxID=47775 RepID=A0AAD3HIG9_9CHLO|nr:hypothetical protein Agub_g2923 [Astrephomene gubernaculifera]